MWCLGGLVVVGVERGVVDVRVGVVVFLVLMIATVSVVVVIREMHIELDARDALAFVLADVQMKTIELKFLEFASEFVRIHA